MNSPLLVDNWSVEHVENPATGDTELVETYTGQVQIGQTAEQKYLGFILSSSGDNMANIRALQKKSIGIIRKIFTKLHSLNLQQYYFEVGMTFMNVMLRSSILYACETCYNLKEAEIRQIERIEESFMRQLIKTTKGCPINQIYLELGQPPARYDIYKLRMFFLKYILDQEEESTIYKMFNLQLQHPTKGDWASTTSNDMKHLNINLSMDDVKKMSLNKFKSLVKVKCQEGAYNYLMNKRGSKGSEVIYPRVEMSEYFLPNNELSIEDKRKLFSIRNKMYQISSNFCSKKNNTSKCVCQETEDMEHIYFCKKLNEEEAQVEYEKLFSGNMNELTYILQRYEENLEKHEHIINEKNEETASHVILTDPLSSILLVNSNGYIYILLATYPELIQWNFQSTIIFSSKRDTWNCL